MNVSLTPELEKFVQKQVASQRYQTASEVIRHALRQMLQDDELKAAHIEGIRQGLAAAEQQIGRGEFMEFRGDQEKQQFLNSIKLRGREKLGEKAEAVRMSNLIRLTRLAADDLDGIWLVIADDSPLNADAFITRLWEAFEQLAQFPLSGRDRGSLRPGYRSYPVGNYLIFYRPLQDGAEIMRVLHGARQLPEALDKP